MKCPPTHSQYGKPIPKTCMYFWIESSDVPYAIGTWTVELLGNEAVVQSR